MHANNFVTPNPPQLCSFLASHNDKAKLILLCVKKRQIKGAAYHCPHYVIRVYSLHVHTHSPGYLSNLWGIFSLHVHRPKQGFACEYYVTLSKVTTGGVMVSLQSCCLLHESRCLTQGSRGQFQWCGSQKKYPLLKQQCECSEGLFIQLNTSQRVVAQCCWGMCFSAWWLH